MDTEQDGFLPDPPHHEILTPRLRLRTARVTDAPSILPVISQHEVMRWASMPPVNSLYQAELWLNNRVLGPDVFNFAVEIRSTSEFIGMIGCFHPPSIGYITSPAHTGRGYTTEALEALIPALFERLPSAGESGAGFDYLEATTDPENWGSRRVLEKAGFRRCGVLENAVEHWLSGLRDTVVYRVARPGKTLEGLGLIDDGVDDVVDPAALPPIQ
ncbi:acyl-CoA N-acyltransferase [Teratosphaeria nubilosa]|uniref:Acyl-CoA N-acyltransferase n=1 Tax=Teratosphaeria nubilosa TaxID=161662 RepID=A0A6G1LI08_9PEZI|nr:acyl-CoA N-acyltransferase [Teratosphaeria nubilosa]